MSASLISMIFNESFQNTISRFYDLHILEEEMQSIESKLTLLHNKKWKGRKTNARIHKLKQKYNELYIKCYYY